ncbi:MAG: hypothetical protein ACTSP4_00725 [Candidatus Hodarchaeales archaeon]
MKPILLLTFLLLTTNVRADDMVIQSCLSYGFAGQECIQDVEMLCKEKGLDGEYRFTYLPSGGTDTLIDSEVSNQSYNKASEQDIILCQAFGYLTITED